MVKFLKSMADFEAAKAESNSSLVVIDFTASWCGPCQMIGPVFEKLASDKYAADNVVFYKVDVDAADDVAQACNISAMPTFQFFKGGQKIEEMKGADQARLVKLIDQHK